MAWPVRCLGQGRVSSCRPREAPTLAWGSHSALGLTSLHYQSDPLMAASTILIDQGSL